MAKSPTKSTTKTKKPNAKAKRMASKSKTTKTSSIKKSPAAKKTESVKISASKKVISSANGPKSSGLTIGSLRNLQRVIAIGLIAQIVLLLIKAKDVRLPIDIGFQTLNEATGNLEGATRTLVDIPVSWLLVSFLATGAIWHMAVVSKLSARYSNYLKNKVNPLRWLERAVTGGLIIVVLAMLLGISSVYLLASLFVFNAVFNFACYFLEESVSRENLKVFAVGRLTGMLPWFVFAAYLIFNQVYSPDNLPSYVYWSVASMFVLSAAYNQVMHFAQKKNGKYSDYVYSERTYLLLGFITSSLLVWQVYLGVLK